MYYIPRRMFSAGCAATARVAVTSLKAPLVPNLPKFCKDCKYFIVPPGIEVKQGLCKRVGKIDLVDGSVSFQLARIAREQHCMGDLFELREVNDFPDA